MSRQFSQLKREISLQNDVQRIQRQQQEVNTIAKNFNSTTSVQVHFLQIEPEPDYSNKP